MRRWIGVTGLEEEELPRVGGRAGDGGGGSEEEDSEANVGRGRDHYAREEDGEEPGACCLRASFLSLFFYPLLLFRK